MKKLIRASEYPKDEDVSYETWKDLKTEVWTLFKDVYRYLCKSLQSRGVEFNEDPFWAVSPGLAQDRYGWECHWGVSSYNLKSTVGVYNRGLKESYFATMRGDFRDGTARNPILDIIISIWSPNSIKVPILYKEADATSDPSFEKFAHSVIDVLESPREDLYTKIDDVVDNAMRKLEKCSFNVKDGVVTPIDISKKPSKPSWRSLVKQLIEDSSDGIDPIYEQTDAGMEIQYACGEVDNKLGVQCIPSTELGRGSMEIYDSDDNLLAELDYEEYNQDVLSLVSESKNKTDFKKKYSEYIDSLIR